MSKDNEPSDDSSSSSSSKAPTQYHYHTMAKMPEDRLIAGTIAFYYENEDLMCQIGEQKVQVIDEQVKNIIGNKPLHDSALPELSDNEKGIISDFTAMMGLTDQVLLINQGTYAFLNQNTPAHLKAMFTAGMGPCCHIIVRNKENGSMVLCHADSSTDLLDIVVPFV